jgi:acetyl esterase/lipase
MKKIVPGAFGLMTCLVLFLSTWVILPAPIDSLLPLSVGAPEISPAVLVGCAVLLLAYLIWRRRASGGGKWQSRLIIIGISWSLVISALPLLQFSGIQKQSEQSMQTVLGHDYLQYIPSALRSQMRTQPLIWKDLWQDIANSPVRIERQIPFANPDGVSLTMNIYRPAQVGKYPGIISIYGGAWQRGNPDSNEDFNRYMAARGYVVWAIDYRHAPAHRFPAHLEDVRSAFQYIQEQAASKETDLSQMAVFGRSAGAHLGLLAAYSWTGFPIKAVVNYYSPVDLTAGYYQPPVPDPIDSKAVLLAFFGGDPQQLPELYRQGSPINYVKPGLPPSLLVYGGKDRLVESKYGKYLTDALKAQGNKAVFIEIPWADHAFDAVFSGVSNQLALYYTERFLAWALLGSA